MLLVPSEVTLSAAFSPWFWGRPVGDGGKGLMMKFEVVGFAGVTFSTPKLNLCPEFIPTDWPKNSVSPFWGSPELVSWGSKLGFLYLNFCGRVVFRKLLYHIDFLERTKYHLDYKYRADLTGVKSLCSPMLPQPPCPKNCVTCIGPLSGICVMSTLNVDLHKRHIANILDCYWVEAVPNLNA